jgi:hypothetical protein
MPWLLDIAKRTGGVEGEGLVFEPDLRPSVEQALGLVSWCRHLDIRMPGKGGIALLKTR